MEKNMWDKTIIDHYRNIINELIARETNEEKQILYSNDLQILEAIIDFKNDGKCFIQPDDFSKKASEDIRHLTIFSDFYEDICSFEKREI